MATVNKDFKIKSGLIVEGTTATVNGYDILTKKQADQDFIVDIIGGETLVKSVSNEFDVSIAGELSIDRATVNAYYDEAGAAGIVAGDLTDHENATEAHGATGAVVGTTNTQTLTNKTLTSPVINTPTGITKSDVGLANVDNTSDADKPVSDATQTALNLKANLDSPTFTGTVTLPNNTISQAMMGDDSVGTNELGGLSVTTAKIADEAVTSGKLATSLDLTGTPTAPTAALGTNNTQIATTAYADAAVAALVGSAPALLDTLQELASAMDNDPETINNLQSLAAGKQDTLTPGSNIDITGATISVTGLDSADISDFSTAAVTANTGLWDTTGAAADAEQNAKDYADDLINDASSSSAEVWSAYKTSTEIGLAQQAAIDVANDLTTDDVAEGTTQYFTDARAKTSAADLITGATKTNITITGDENGLTITAENGVADSTTADLAEDPAATPSSGTMYFTDARALTAINDSNIQPSSIDITWVRREEATWTDVNTASKVACHSTGTGNGSMKYLVRVVAQVGGVRHSHVTEVLATVAGDNSVAVVEYGTIYTSENPLATVTVEWNAGTSNYDLNVTTANNNSEVMVAATLIATID